MACLAQAIGMVVRYWALNKDNALAGWAIPMATDIAFALGVALLNKHVPSRNCSMTLAIIDGAIIVIALFIPLTCPTASSGRGGVLDCAVAMNRLGVIKLGRYMIIGLILWVCVLKSGVRRDLGGCNPWRSIPTAHKNAKPHRC